MAHDALERVTVEIDSAQFDFWSEVSIDYSVEQAARTASLVCADLGGALIIRPSMPCRILASGDLVLTGYVRDVKPEHSESGHSVNVSMVSRTVDLVEASSAMDAHALPALVDRAAQTLAGARSAAEVLEARDRAAVAYDAARSAARLAAAKGAYDDLIPRIHRAQADALVIEASAKRRLADEYDAAQERGEVRQNGGDRTRIPNQNSATVADIGLTHKDIHEARIIRDAEASSPGIVRETVEAALIDHPSGFLMNVDLKAIAEGFDTAGIGVDVHGSFPVEPRRFVNTGENWFRHMEPLMRVHDAFIYDDERGRAQIATKPRGRHTGTLAIGDGGNIIAASATLTEQGRFSKVKVRGQSSRGETPAALQPEAEAEDDGVGRERTQIVTLETEATPQKLANRAKQAVRRAAGYSREATVTVSG